MELPADFAALAAVSGRSGDGPAGRAGRARTARAGLPALRGVLARAGGDPLGPRGRGAGACRSTCRWAPRKGPARKRPDLRRPPRTEARVTAGATRGPAPGTCPTPLARTGMGARAAATRGRARRGRLVGPPDRGRGARRRARGAAPGRAARSAGRCAATPPRRTVSTRTTCGARRTCGGCSRRRPGMRAAAVVGAFHGPALLTAGTRARTRPRTGGPDHGSDVGGPRGRGRDDLPRPVHLRAAGRAVRLPAGIRDPEWQQGVVEAAGDPAAAATSCWSPPRYGSASRCGRPAIRAGRPTRARWSGSRATWPPLRGLPAAGRGELAGGGPDRPGARAVVRPRPCRGAGAGERCWSATGTAGWPRAPRVRASAPRCEKQLDALGLPGPGAPQPRRELRLDPSRSPLDRRREVTLRRLALCGVPYGEADRVAGVGPGASAVTGTRWRWSGRPATAAMVDASRPTGVTAVRRPRARCGSGPRSTLRRRWRPDRGAEVLTGLEDAAGCGLPGLAADTAGRDCHAGARLRHAARTARRAGLLDRLGCGPPARPARRRARRRGGRRPRRN